MKKQTTKVRGTLHAVLATVLIGAGMIAASGARAAVPGVTGPISSSTPSFNLVASADYASQPDGAMIYSWGYGCASAPAGFLPAPTANSAGPGGNCPAMQMPGPTLIVKEGDTVSVTLTNALPPAAGNTSIIFAGQQVTATGGVAGAIVQEAATGGTVTYSFTASKPGTYAYYSGSQSELQIQMGLFGVVVVVPNAASAATAACPKGAGEYALAASAYANSDTCYDREYLFQFSEIDYHVHDQAKAQVDACPVAPCPQINVLSEPYKPQYFLVNARSMPDIQDTSYASGYVHQPYNGNPHMHPGERVLLRVVGQGRLQHPFHYHANHARVIARDGNLIVSQSDPTKLAGPLLFTIPTVSGQSVDAIFTWTGKGLNWDVYNHKPADNVPCVPDANGYYTGGVSNNPAAPNFAPNYGEWCADHNKPIPVTPPDPNIVAIGQWYGGTPYLGLQSAPDSGFTPTTEPPGTLNQNPEAGYAYMWHSHNEREITTNDVFPGGMLMMLLIDPPSWYIDETL